jgi:ribosome-binding factor A
MAGTTRQLKFGRLIQKEISEIFQRDKRGILDNAFVTVTEVRVSPDLGVAKVYVSMMLAKDKAAILTKITSRKGEIRKALGDKIRKQVRVIPELIFFVDEVEENAQRMDSLINNLKIPAASATEEE